MRQALGCSPLLRVSSFQFGNLLQELFQSIPPVRRRFRILFIVLNVSAASLGSVAWVAGTILVKPAPAVVGHPPNDLPAQDVAIPSGSGSILHGWYVDCPGSNAAVALFHGVRGNRGDLTARARLLRAQGYSVLLIDFQAHGESPGAQMTFGYLESRDSEAAIAWLHQRLPRARVGAIGISLGGASLALAHHPLQLDAVVLESAYSTLDAAVENRVSLALWKFGPVVKPFLTAQLHPRLGVDLDFFRPIDHLSDVGCPLLIASGATDQRTLISETRAMYAAARSPKELWIVPNVAHLDLLRWSPDEYRKRVLGFLATYLKR